jgi:hypothetical protein
MSRTGTLWSGSSARAPALVVKFLSGSSSPGRARARPRDRQRTEAIRIILEPATFQQVAGRNPAYAVPTGLHCPEKYVAFPSSCRPARTWIDRESKGLTTDTTLSIPYCRGQDRAYRILLRLGDGSIAIGKLWSRLAR